MIFRYRQTHRHFIIIYISLSPSSPSPPSPSSTSWSSISSPGGQRGQLDDHLHRQLEAFHEGSRYHGDDRWWLWQERRGLCQSQGLSKFVEIDYLSLVFPGQGLSRQVQRGRVPQSCLLWKPDSKWEEKMSQVKLKSISKTIILKKNITFVSLKVFSTVSWKSRARFSLGLMTFLLARILNRCCCCCCSCCSCCCWVDDLLTGADIELAGRKQMIWKLLIEWLHNFLISFDKFSVVSSLLIRWPMRSWTSSSQRCLTWLWSSSRWVV